MQLDSHRRQHSFTMPCRWSRRCQSAPREGITDTVNNVDLLDEVPVKARFAHRMGNMRQMRRQTRRVVLLMALIEALRVGPAEMVFAGKDGYKAPGEDDFGIAYWVGFMLSYIYVCIFMIVFVPLFSVRIPLDIPSTSTAILMTAPVVGPQPPYRRLSLWPLRYQSNVLPQEL